MGRVRRTGTGFQTRLAPRSTGESQKAEIAELKGQVENFNDPSGFTDEQVAALEKLKKLLDSGISRYISFNLIYNCRLTFITCYYKCHLI